MDQEFNFIERIPPTRGNLILGLQAVQEERKYISDAAIEAAAEYFSTPLAEVEGVVSFYSQFKRQQPGQHHIQICDGTACHIKGSALLTEWISVELGISPGETDAEGLFSIETVACLGCCSLAPVMSVGGKVFGKLDRKRTLKILRDYRRKGESS